MDLQELRFHVIDGDPIEQVESLFQTAKLLHQNGAFDIFYGRFPAVV